MPTATVCRAHEFVGLAHHLTGIARGLHLTVPVAWRNDPTVGARTAEQQADGWTIRVALNRPVGEVAGDIIAALLRINGLDEGSHEAGELETAAAAWELRWA